MIASNATGTGTGTSSSSSSNSNNNNNNNNNNSNNNGNGSGNNLPMLTIVDTTNVINNPTKSLAAPTEQLSLQEDVDILNWNKIKLPL